MRAAAAVVALAAGLALPAGSGEAAAASGPLVRQLVVFRDGSAVSDTVRARAASVRVRGRRCALAAGTPLAALVRSRPGRLRLRDFGSCSRRSRDAAGLYVAGIRRDFARGREGWVYKLGNRLATAGAADPSGPFGRGRLRSRANLTWFFCRLEGRSCQRTLVARPALEAGGGVSVTVRGYDDEGRGSLVKDVTVRAGAVSAQTGPDGVARLALPRGRHSVFAEGDGLIRSPSAEVRVG